MSIVVRNKSIPDQPAVLFCKGADNVMMGLMDMTSEEQDYVNEHLYEFSVEGLRTLVLSYKELTEEET